MSPFRSLAPARVLALGLAFSCLPLAARAQDLPFLVKDVNPASDSFPDQLTDVDGTLFFTASTGSISPEIWRSDGTALGTGPVADVGLFFIVGPVELTSANSMLFFAAAAFDPVSGTAGVELWRSDGTPAGTVLVKDINPGSFLGGPFSSFPSELTDVDGTLFFTASGLATGAELWRSDGTEAGTTLVKDIVPGGGSSHPGQLTDVDGTLFFAAEGPGTGNELWRSDGTAAGTVLVADIAVGSNWSFPTWLTNVGGTLFFTAFSPIVGREVWRSDGTAAGTVLVKDIVPGVNSVSPENLVDVDGTLFLTVADPASGRELWRSDGTAAGTVLVKDIVPGSGDSAPAELTNVNGTLFFTAVSSGNGVELWRSDGTAAGTVLVKDIVPGSDSSDPADLTAGEGTVFFTALDPTSGRELWRSDGTAAGTTVVGDIYPGPDGSFPSGLTNVSGRLFFSAREPNTGVELWAIGSPSPCCDGTIDAGEDCDAGPDTGSPGSCCAADCTLRAAGGLCRPLAHPCDAAETCDGQSPSCPADSPAPAGSPCAGAGDLCASSAVCNSAGACEPVVGPQPGCKAPIESGRAKVDLRDDETDKGSWTWTKGTATAKAEFGDPTSATDYALCIYDTTAGTPSLALAARIPAGGTCGTRPCWKATKAGFQYANKAGTGDGLTKLTLKQGLLPGQAKISAKGKGVNFPLPALPLAQDPTVTVQLKSRTGACWTADFSTAIENDAGRLKAKSD